MLSSRNERSIQLTAAEIEANKENVLARNHKKAVTVAEIKGNSREFMKKANEKAKLYQGKIKRMKERGEDNERIFIICQKLLLFLESIPNLGRDKIEKLYKKCLNMFIKDPRFCEKEEYVQMWLRFSEFCHQKESAILKHMRDNKIGLKSPGLYLAVASCSVRHNQLALAEQAYVKGIANVPSSQEKNRIKEEHRCFVEYLEEKGLKEELELQKQAVAVKKNRGNNPKKTRVLRQITSRVADEGHRLESIRHKQGRSLGLGTQKCQATRMNTSVRFEIDIDKDLEEFVSEENVEGEPTNKDKRKRIHCVPLKAPLSMDEDRENAPALENREQRVMDITVSGEERRFGKPVDERRRKRRPLGHVKAGDREEILDVPMPSQESQNERNDTHIAFNDVNEATLNTMISGLSFSESPARREVTNTSIAFGTPKPARCNQSVISENASFYYSDGTSLTHNQLAK